MYMCVYVYLYVYIYVYVCMCIRLKLWKPTVGGKGLLRRTGSLTEQNNKHYTINNKQ